VEKTESLGPASYQQETIWISSWLQLHDIKHELKSDLISLHTHQVWHNEDKTVDEFVTMDFFGLIITAKLLNTGILSSKYPKTLLIVRRCI